MSGAVHPHLVEQSNIEWTAHGFSLIDLSSGCDSFRFFHRRNVTASPAFTPVLFSPCTMLGDPFLDVDTRAPLFHMSAK